MDPFAPLDPSREEIRLLRLDFNSPPEKRAHRLISPVQFKSTERKYVALSYPWGDVKEHTTLPVDGRSVHLTTNLSRALDEVIQMLRRTNGNLGDDVYLWADQLCVNLSDKDEKSHQVRLMADIYRHADEVLVWLPLSRGVRASFATFGEWANWHRAQLEPSQLPRGQEMRYSAVDTSTGDYPILAPEDRQDREALSAWANIYEIIESPWWKRAWILPEFVCSKEATVLIDGMSMDWRDLQDLLSRFFNQRKSHSKFLRNKEDALKREDSKVEESDEAPGCFDSCCGSGGKLSAQPAPSDSARNAQKHQLEYIQRYTNRYAKADESWEHANYILNSRMQRLKQSPESYQLLSDLLKHGRDRQSAEPRDKVYALLGLATPSYGIIPDYTKPSNTVFLETARAIIVQERRLDILAVARENRKTKDGAEPLPSWVPDWSDGHNAQHEYRKFLRETKFLTAKYRASQNTAAQVAFHSRFLEVQAIRADRLSELTEDQPYRPYRSFKTNEGREVYTVKAAREGDDIWVLFGANEPLVLRRAGSYHTILGHAMIYEAGKISPVMDGALIGQLEVGRVLVENILIT